MDGRYCDAQFIKMLKDELAQYENDGKEEDDDLEIEWENHVSIWRNTRARKIFNPTKVKREIF